MPEIFYEQFEHCENLVFYEICEKLPLKVISKKITINLEVLQKTDILHLRMFSGKLIL